MSITKYVSNIFGSCHTRVMSPVNHQPRYQYVVLWTSPVTVTVTNLWQLLSLLFSRKTCNFSNSFWRGQRHESRGIGLDWRVMALLYLVTHCSFIWYKYHWYQKRIFTSTIHFEISKIIQIILVSEYFSDRFVL